MIYIYLRESVHLLFVPEDLQHAGTYWTTGSWKEVRGHGLLQYNPENCWVHDKRQKSHSVRLTLFEAHCKNIIFKKSLNGDSSVFGVLTWRGDRPAAWRWQRWARDNAARRVWSHVRQRSYSMTGALVVHSHAVREGFTHSVVGLAVMAAHTLRFPAGLLRREHNYTMIYLLFIS